MSNFLRYSNHLRQQSREKSSRNLGFQKVAVTLEVIKFKFVHCLMQVVQRFYKSTFQATQQSHFTGMSVKTALCATCCKYSSFRNLRPTSETISQKEIYFHSSHVCIQTLRQGMQSEGETHIFGLCSRFQLNPKMNSNCFLKNKNHAENRKRLSQRFLLKISKIKNEG